MSAGQSGEDRRSLQSGLGQSGPMTARVPRMCGLGDTVKFFGTINPLVFIWQEHVPPRSTAKLISPAGTPGGALIFPERVAGRPVVGLRVIRLPTGSRRAMSRSS